jgi:hypothetical protein
MPYMGNTTRKASDIRRFDVTGSTSATHTLTWTAPNEQSLIVTVNGVKQHEDAYSVSGTTLSLTSALISTDKLEVIGINDIGTTITPAQNSVDTDKILDDAVTADKLANSINTEIAANTAKVTNATHTGDVTGATALTIASGAVDLAMLSATGTASATTFLRGDNAWASAGGLTHASLWDMNTTFTGSADPITTNLSVWPTEKGYVSLGADMTESGGVFTFPTTGIWIVEFMVCFQISSAASRYNNSMIWITTDNGSAWEKISMVRGNLFNSSDWTYGSAVSWVMFDVTSTTTHKVRFGVSVANASTQITQSRNASGDQHGTGIKFLRLADT